MDRTKQVTVIGAGVVGLTTAVMLQERGTNTRIVSRHLPRQTTSAAAGAIWYPYLTDDPRLETWLTETYVELLDLADRKVGGVQKRELWEWFPDPTPDPFWAHIPERFSRLSPTDMLPDRSDGWKFTNVVIDSVPYLEWLTHRFTAAGGELSIEAIDQVSSMTGTVINCSGVAARHVAADPTTYPIRGQVIRVRNPGIEHALLDAHGPDGVAYVFPRATDCILGGTTDPHEWDLAGDDRVTEQIIDRCAKLDQRIRGAEILDVQVGLRPARPTVRIEREDSPNGTTIHNYGHAGSGYTISWATAREAIALLDA